MIGLSIAFIIIVLIVLYSLARTAGESDRTMEQDNGTDKRAITPRKGGKLWWEQLRKEIDIKNKDMCLKKRS